MYKAPRQKQNNNNHPTTKKRLKQHVRKQTSQSHVKRSITTSSHKRQRVKSNQQHSISPTISMSASHFSTLKFPLQSQLLLSHQQFSSPLSPSSSLYYTPSYYNIPPHHRLITSQRQNTRLHKQQISFFSTTTSTKQKQITTPQMSNKTVEELICLDAFARRQFQPKNESGFISADPEGFLVKVREIIAQKMAEKDGDFNALLADGYAPFCKHIFIENFTEAKPASVKITQDNKGLIETDYIARTEKELPVLTRFLPLEKIGGKDAVPTAKYLDLILYSREQIIKENAAMGNENVDTADWGIISIKAQNENFETPMLPITVLRNISIELGGSGQPLDVEAYKKSVAYWKDHISLQ